VCRASDLRKTIQQLRENGIRVVACTEKASKLIYEVDLRSPVALVMGSEEDGISPDILRVADDLAKIPMKGRVGSLNVSVAAGVAIYETIRQKLL
jgi:23S rRNA (guanosine2251-2'-O)-methyltransferase